MKKTNKDNRRARAGVVQFGTVGKVMAPSEAARNNHNDSVRWSHQEGADGGRRPVVTGTFFGAGRAELTVAVLGKFPEERCYRMRVRAEPGPRTIEHLGPKGVSRSSGGIKRPSLIPL